MIFLPNKPTMIVLHCSDVSWKLIRDQFTNVNSYHKSEGFNLSSLGFYVGYHHLVTGGKDYKCKEDDEVGCHTNQVVNGVSVNLQSIGICCGFDGDSELPHPVDYVIYQKLVWDYQDKYKIPNSQVYFHRHFNMAKTCPGSLCTDAWLATLLTRPLPAPVVAKPADQCAKQEAIIATQQGIISRFVSIFSTLNAKK